MNNPEYKKIVDGSGFTYLDLMGAYVSTIECTMPVPVAPTASGGRQFVTEFNFKQPESLALMLSVCANELKAAGIPLEAPPEERVGLTLGESIQRLQQPPSQRRVVINRAFADEAKRNKQFLESNFGPVDFPIDRTGSGVQSPQGCAALLIVSIALCEIVRNSLF
jgi:hypothetical protein